MISEYFTELPPDCDSLPGRFLFDLTLTAAPPVVIGNTGLGELRAVKVTGGSFAGPGMNGVVSGGEDWIVISSRGTQGLDVRLSLITEEKHQILMRYKGFRHGPAEVMERLGRGETVPPDEYYFRICATFKTGSKEYARLNSLFALGYGKRGASSVHYRLFEIL